MQAELLVFHDPKLNGVYNQYPFKLARKSVCDMINVEYRKYIMNDLRDTTNLPYTSDKNANLCKMFELVISNK